MRCAQARHVRRSCAVGDNRVRLDAELGQEARQLFDVVAMAETERGGAEDVATHTRRALHRLCERPNDLQQRLISAEVLSPLVARQLQRNHGDRQTHPRGKAPGVVLDELGGAGGTDHDGLGPEAFVGVAAGVLEELSGISAEVASLEGRVGDGRAGAAALDHGKEEVGVGIALGRVQDEVQAAHRGGDPHGAHMRRPLVGPDGELHSAASRRGASPAMAALRRSGRAKRPARSPACS